MMTLADHFARLPLASGLDQNGFVSESRGSKVKLKVGFNCAHGGTSGHRVKLPSLRKRAGAGAGIVRHSHSMLLGAIMLLLLHSTPMMLTVALQERNQKLMSSENNFRPIIGSKWAKSNGNSRIDERMGTQTHRVPLDLAKKANQASRSEILPDQLAFLHISSDLELEHDFSDHHKRERNRRDLEVQSGISKTILADLSSRSQLISADNAEPIIESRSSTDKEDSSTTSVPSDDSNGSVNCDYEVDSTSAQSGELQNFGTDGFNMSTMMSSNVTSLLKHQAGQCNDMSGNVMIEMITKVITPILFSIIILVGLIGNIAVMLIILEDKKTELTPANLLILDLSLGDLTFIIFCIPFTGWDYAVGHWVFGHRWCQMNQYLIVVCALSSIYTLVLMSVDRFMAVVFPIVCLPYRTSKNTLLAIGLKWGVILILAAPVVRMHGLMSTSSGPIVQYNCRFLVDQYDALQFQIIFFMASYLVPLVLIFCLYVSLLNKLWFGAKPEGHKESLKMLESKKKVTWLVAGIVIVFAICWCPIQIMLILMRLQIHKITATYVAIQVFAHTLGYMNSCINPIVYAFASENFHNSFKRSSLGRLCRHCLPCIGTPTDHHERSITNLRNFHTTTSMLNHQGQHGHSMVVNHFSSSIRDKTRGAKSNELRVESPRGRISLPASVGQIPSPSSNGKSDDQSEVPLPQRSNTPLPLEPRDRQDYSPMVLGQSSINDPQAESTNSHQNIRDSTRSMIELDCEQGEITSKLQKEAKHPGIQRMKQQLVAQVDQANANQISHRCQAIRNS